MQAAFERASGEPEPDIGTDTPPASNPFFAEWALDAAVRNLAVSGKRVDIVSARGDVPVPVSPWLSAPAGLGAVWSVWDHIHCFDTTPAGTSDAATVLDAVLGHVNGRGAAMLRWAGLPTDTPFYRNLIRHVRDAGLHHESARARSRPLLVSADPVGSDVEAIRLGGKRMAEFRRRRRRLEDMGTLAVQVHSGSHDADVWIGDFLELEASGWKGENGTAIACDPGERAFFEQFMLAAADRGNALVCSLELDGHPVAMTANLRSGLGAWGFKTAYRDELSRYSPGVLVACETTMHVLEEPSLAWMDSCIDDDFGVVGTLWHRRRETVDLMISTRPSGNWLPGAAKMALNALRLARTVQSAAVRSLERSISRIVTGITSIVVLPEIPTVVLMTASI